MDKNLESPSTSSNVVWRRLATARETLFGLKTDGTIRSICSNLEIISAGPIDHELLEVCAEYFNKDMCCFREFLMEKKESKDIWLVEAKKNDFIFDELENEDDVIEDEMNCPFRSENIPNWKLYYKYIGYDKSGNFLSFKYPYIYQLLFVFSTGTLDEFSCSLLCDLFLNILDGALKQVRLQSYSDLKMYDVGSQLVYNINLAMQGIQNEVNDTSYSKEIKVMSKIFSDPCSNFEFTKKELKNKDTKFVTRRCFISLNKTNNLFKICNEKDIGVYAVFIVIINNVLLQYAVKKGFKGIFRTRVLHIINARFILNLKDKKYTYKLGSHSLPYLQYFKLESIDIEEIFKEARRVESELEGIVKRNWFWNLEAMREVCIKESSDKFNSGKWNPHYCFSVTNLGNLNCFYTAESPNNKILLRSYERASSALEGGHLDVIFHTFRGMLSVYFDFSMEYFSHDEMSSMIETFKQIIDSLV
ncbi:UNVERIFIED_CONTAM: hypothetical protein RMT77_010442 [Armadillidium vulgare]